MLRIEELRENHEPPLTKEALARAAGVSVRTVWRAERLGRAQSTTLLKIAAALDVPLGDLYAKESA